MFAHIEQKEDGTYTFRLEDGSTGSEPNLVGVNEMLNNREVNNYELHTNFGSIMTYERQGAKWMCTDMKFSSEENS